MTGAERGFALLCSHLGDPQRRPLTTAQLRQLHRRVRLAQRPEGERELEAADLVALGYGQEEARRIAGLLSQEKDLDDYLWRAEDCRLLTPVSRDYPARLWKALGEDAPGCLWAKGDLGVLDFPAIALVGSRELQPENEAFARQVGRCAAEQGVTLVSGNARGADQTAQNACLEAGGRVVSIVADGLEDKELRPGLLWLNEVDFDALFTPERALCRNRCIHALGFAAIAAQCSLKTGGTWDGSVRNLRHQWSPVYVFDDGSPASKLLEQMGAVLIGPEALQNLQALPPPAQLHL